MSKLGFHQRNSDEWKRSYIWPKEDVHLWRHLNKKKYGSIVPRTITNLTKRKGCIIQAGGACGIYADYYSNHFSKVWTFEPDPDNFYCLKQNCNLVPEHNIIAFQCALGSKIGSACLHNDRKNFGANYIVENSDIKTRVLTIDNLGIIPDVIHLDVEGYETNILKGATETIEKYSPMLVLETVDKDYVIEKLGYTNVGTIGADTIFRRL